ncbi:MAG: hypothetical protein GX345_06865 [Clostridiales bacterium]|nr:hypothetical protein [Clostridiales bacterium]
MKKILTFSTVFLALILFFAPVKAADLPPVNDNAELLSDYKLGHLNQLAQEMGDSYGLDLALMVVEDMGVATNAQQYAQALYEEHGFGRGDDKSGLLFLLNMQERDWAFHTQGRAEEIFGDFEEEILNDQVLPKLGQEDYYSAFSSFYDELNLCLARWEVEGSDRADKPVQTEGDGQNTSDKKMGVAGKIILILVLPLLVAGIVCFTFYQKMKTAHEAKSAHQYLSEEGLILTHKEDRYTHQEQTTRRIERDDSSSSSSSGGSSSSGSSGGSGKF